MFAIQGNNGKFFCYTDNGIQAGFKDPAECVNLWINISPAFINRHRNRLRKSYRGYNIKTVELTPQQLEYFTFVKLRGK